MMTASSRIARNSPFVLLICLAASSAGAFIPVPIRSFTTRGVVSSVGGGEEQLSNPRARKPTPPCHRRCWTTSWKSAVLKASASTDDDDLFDIKTTLFLVGGQSLLIGAAVILALFLKTPNYGLGPDINFSTGAIADGVLKALPLGFIAYLLDFVEQEIPALRQVTLATQRSVMALLGGTFKPIVGLLVSIALGLAAGVGEEMLFRGVLQYELTARIGQGVALGVTAIIFGLLHAVTPAYALLATLASLYFGYLYQTAGNLAVPITTHALYDVCALMYAHWAVSRLTKDEQEVIFNWEPPPLKAIDVVAGDDIV
ncbi:CAAX protease self-immunity [Fragilaria crotonensis]|nr:CAAX protease self-immunity [Fragilaria crotonensis]